MKLRNVIVEAAVYTVVSGNVGLTAEQARTRLHNLKPLAGRAQDNPDKAHYRAGEYEVIAPIAFKRGEKFGYSGAVGKNGELHDPEAEELQRMEKAESQEHAVKAAVTDAVERVRREYETKLEKAVGERVATELAKLQPELEAKIRAELATQKPQ